MKTILVSYRVSDRDRSLTFYTTLGYLEVGRVDVETAELVMLRLPDESSVSLELVCRPSGGPISGESGFDHLAIEVDDLVRTRARLVAGGLKPTPIGHPGGPDGPTTCFVTDPDGYRIELVQWPDGSKGGMTEADFD
ncbi:VOC family protein [Microlunatus soli]|uniref:Lactoylglutathione lyase n=1 Tax=Microlunatus soli TaxID=630515 RepID=A0A1H1ZC24_9ACTN|nr:VOC family protein [Microlunatus soli]SDT31274.1 lactoylglutathione lyase [Microlunatus soli]